VGKNAGRGSKFNPVARFVATGAFVGYAPVAPGTVGSLVCAAALWAALPEVTLGSPAHAIWIFGVSLGAFIAMAVWAARAAEGFYGTDSSRIVIDEFAGYIVAIALLPKSLMVYAAAFLLFRFLDIVKPFPAARAESLGGGWGVVLDDLVAGLYANVLVRVMLLVKGV